MKTTGQMLRDSINTDRLINNFLELISIDSMSFQEQVIGEVLAGKLIGLGFSVSIQSYGDSFNLVGYKKGNATGAMPLMLSSHMDTVESTGGIRVIRENGVIKTDGKTVLGADDKSGIVEILEALRVIEDMGLSVGDIEVLFTSAEERGLHGAKNFDYTLLQSKHALVLDSSGSVGRVVVSAPTHDAYTMRISGRSAHAGIEPEKGINAITAAAKIISELPDGRIDPVTTANIGTIWGGSATNVVPREVVIEGEMRSHTLETIERLKESMFEMATKLARKHQVKIHIEDKRHYVGFKIADDDPFVRLIDVALHKSGTLPEHLVYGGGSDANVFNERGIKSLVLSTGMQQPHTTEEHIYVNDLTSGALAILETIVAFRDFRVG
ncbi:MAG: M20/M25/M40 family metallo-hydrolase [Nitrospirae bacterium]|nr:M20/M25/M40 family metallo-hydrolase [Nitrospirota bacterium]MBF0533477.1 M20/M25/M40 family metallo-hydrolase [Nitrospirota bacterium]MBF0615999.1 M20/M25/M40 family metallo-hydrolase [Nitrospirota bacterium]